MTPQIGARGQVLCDGCRQCQLGYHCSACGRAWRGRAAARSRTRTNWTRAARRARLTRGDYSE